MERISSQVTPGIETSRMTISGAKLRSASMQLIPSLQHATMLKSRWAPSTLLKPCRTTGWRSAIKTLIQRIGRSSACRPNNLNPTRPHLFQVHLKRDRSNFPRIPHLLMPRRKTRVNANLPCSPAGARPKMKVVGTSVKLRIGLVRQSEAALHQAFLQFGCLNRNFHNA